MGSARVSRATNIFRAERICPREDAGANPHMINLYPLVLISDLQIARADVVVSDDFEDGTTAARRLWSTNTFRRRYRIQHAPLGRDEFAYLRAFYNQCGMLESFFFRDNTQGRTG